MFAAEVDGVLEAVLAGVEGFVAALNYYEGVANFDGVLGLVE